jgi:hypothetical protein
VIAGGELGLRERVGRRRSGGWDQLVVVHLVADGRFGRLRAVLDCGKGRGRKVVSWW